MLREDIQKKNCIKSEIGIIYLTPLPPYLKSEKQKNEILVCLRPPSPLAKSEKFGRIDSRRRVRCSDLPLVLSGFSSSKILLISFGHWIISVTTQVDPISGWFSSLELAWVSWKTGHVPEPLPLSQQPAA